MFHTMLRAYKQRQTKIAAGLAVVLMLWTAILPTGSVYAESVSATDSNVTTSDVAVALTNAVGVISSSDTTKTSSDGDSAMVSAIDGKTIDVPKDASEGVTMSTSDGTRPAIEVSLPNAKSAGDAQKVANGVVAYPSGNGSANAVQATEDGGVRMLTVIDNADAPTAYDYKITVPSGGHIELSQEGGAVIVAADGQTIASVAPAWATDASGSPVHTYFTTDGQSLVQHVDHTTQGVAYPVTADPSISFGWSIYVRYSKAEVRSVRSRGPLVGYGIAYTLTCGKLPSWAMAGCGVSLGVAYWAIDKTFDAAASENKCVEVRFDYTGGLDGWKRYSC